jgi:single-strand DNA-binding protein
MPVQKSLNIAEVMGVVGRDPEVRTSTAGLVAMFSVATHEAFKGRDGQWQDRTEWHHVVAFGPNAEMVRDHIKKGMRVSARGKMKTRSWEHSKYQGVICTRTEIIADLVSPMLTLPTRLSNPASATRSMQASRPNSPVAVPSSPSDEEYSENEYEMDPAIPF